MQDSNLNLNNLLLPITHLLRKLIIEEKIRALVKIHLAIKAPVERLKKCGFTERIITEDDGDILIGITGKIHFCGSSKLTEVLHP